MNDSNLSLWRRHCHTDPANTKPVNQRGGYTAINPQSQAEAATAQWGPYGWGWGLRDLKYELLGEAPNQFLVLTCRFFYHHEDECEFEVAADMSFRVGDDCFKKLRTQCQSKALSLLGFNADVYAGDWDSEGYQDRMRTRFGDQDNRLRAGSEAIAKADAAMLEKIIQKVDREAGDGTLDHLVAEQLRAAIDERRVLLKAAMPAEDARVSQLFDTAEQPEGVGI